MARTRKTKRRRSRRREQQSPRRYRGTRKTRSSAPHLDPAEAPGHDEEARAAAQAKKAAHKEAVARLQAYLRTEKTQRPQRKQGELGLFTKEEEDLARKNTRMSTSGTSGPEWLKTMERLVETLPSGGDQSAKLFIINKLPNVPVNELEPYTRDIIEILEVLKDARQKGELVYHSIHDALRRVTAAQTSEDRWQEISQTGIPLGIAKLSVGGPL